MPIVHPTLFSDNIIDFIVNEITPDNACCDFRRMIDLTKTNLQRRRLYLRCGMKTMSKQKILGEISGKIKMFTFSLRNK